MLRELTKKTHYIWVNVPGGVQGYTPEDIYEFEHEWRVELNAFPDKFWDMFNFHFMENGEEPGASSFSSICSDPIAWEELYRIRRENA